MRVLFLGQSCAGAAPPLTTLLETGHDVPAIILAGEPGDHPGEPERIAGAADIPVVWVASAAGAAAAIRAAAPEAAAAACFPWRLGRDARKASPLGILNIHPSLLPVGRGPQPVFWTLRRGEPVTGATVHFMDAGLDTGPIAAQETKAVPEGDPRPGSGTRPHGLRRPSHHAGIASAGGGHAACPNRKVRRASVTRQRPPRPTGR